MNLKTLALSAAALIAFAGNSVLCRLALSNGDIDPVSFTIIRLVSGAISLLVLLRLSTSANNEKASYENPNSENTSKAASIYNLKSWAPSLMLFVYAALFSFAYISLDTGVGALILFGFVQVTMLLINLARGNRLSAFEFLGLIIACSGLVYLVFPELSKPSISGFVMMSIAGMAWGVYTMLGQGSNKPLADTSTNFSRSLLFALILLIPFINQLEITQTTLWLAIGSGAITSGIGYAIWYAVLPKLSMSQAGVMQLMVPIIAAIGGVVFAQEVFSIRLAIASALTLGGILLVLIAKQKRA